MTDREPTATMSSMPPWNHGPIEENEWSQELQGRVVAGGDCPRLHGYDVEGDLARFYNWTECVLLTLTGELPTQPVVMAFNVAAAFLGPMSVAHASTHASVLARICGAPTGANVGVAAIALGEQTRRQLDEHTDLLKWRAAPDEVFPEQFRGTASADIEGLQRLKDALSACQLHVVGLEHSPTRFAALVLTLFACGLRRRPQIEAIITLCRMPAALAEAFGERVANFRSYPIDLPHFAYESNQ